MKAIAIRAENATTVESALHAVNGRACEHTYGSPRNMPTSIPTSSGELVLIRGVPGSGKTTMAKILALVGFEHFEADLFFERDDGTYRYDASRIKDAHAWCQDSCRKALANGKRVVVANTFTRLQEMEPYWSMTDKVRVLEAPGRWQNVHGVPPERVAAMAERWEELPSIRPLLLS